MLRSHAMRSSAMTDGPTFAAVGLFEFGGPSMLTPVRLAEPHAGTGAVRVRVRAAAVSPADAALRRGAQEARLRSSGPPPYVPGMDVAGVVDEIGGRVRGELHLGAEVMGALLPDGSRGGYGELVVLPEDSVVPVPAGTSLRAAATLPMNGLAAQAALAHLSDAPRLVAVTGAAGTLGGYVVELAVAAGHTVVADCASADAGWVGGLGAHVLVPRGPEVAQEIRRRFPEGVDALVDAAVQGDAVLPAVRDGGTYVAVRAARPAAERGIGVKGIQVTGFLRDRGRLEQLRAQVEAGVLHPRVARMFRPDEAPQAHRILEAGGVRGRMVIEF